MANNKEVTETLESTIKDSTVIVDSTKESVSNALKSTLKKEDIDSSENRKENIIGMISALAGILGINDNEEEGCGNPLCTNCYPEDELRSDFELFTFDIRLDKIDKKYMLSNLKLLRDTTDCRLFEGKALLEDLPAVIKTNVSYSDMKKITKEFENLGGELSIKVNLTDSTKEKAEEESGKFNEQPESNEIESPKADNTIYTFSGEVLNIGDTFYGLTTSGYSVMGVITKDFDKGEFIFLSKNGEDFENEIIESERFSIEDVLNALDISEEESYNVCSRLIMYLAKQSSK